jgi:hypothetical protein
MGLKWIEWLVMEATRPVLVERGVWLLSRFSRKIPENRLINNPPKVSKAATSIDTKF